VAKRPLGFLGQCSSRASDGKASRELLVLLVLGGEELRKTLLTAARTVRGFGVSIVRLSVGRL